MNCRKKGKNNQVKRNKTGRKTKGKGQEDMIK